MKERRMAMTGEDEDYLFDTLAQLKREVRLNNLMLCDIIKVINVYLANHHQENEDDFFRNVLANLISSGIDIGKVFRK